MQWWSKNFGDTFLFLEFLKMDIWFLNFGRLPEVMVAFQSKSWNRNLHPIFKVLNFEFSWIQSRHLLFLLKKKSELFRDTVLLCFFSLHFDHFQISLDCALSRYISTAPPLLRRKHQLQVLTNVPSPQSQAWRSR